MFRQNNKKSHIIFVTKKLKAIKTIEILNLNEDNLCEYRKTYIINIINTIRKLNDDEKIEIINYFDEFPTLKKFLIENIGALKEII